MDTFQTSEALRCVALAAGGTAAVWVGAWLLSARTPAPAPTPAPKPAPESLDAALARLKAKAGAPVDAIQASRFAEMRDPTAFAPTPETIALARQYQAYELRLKRNKARREAVARFKGNFRSTFRALSRRLGIWS